MATNIIVGTYREAIRHIGWSEVARRTGIHRETLHRQFRKGSNPKIETLEAVGRAIGLRVIATAT